MTGVGPLLAWRKTSLDSLKRNFGWPALTGVAAGAVAFAFGFREFYALVCLILCVFVTSTIGMEFYRGARVIRARSGASLVASAVDLTMRNTRRYGGYIVHVGMVLIFIGLAGAAFNRDAQKEMQLGSTLQIGPYKLLLQSYDQKAEKNYTAERMIVEGRLCRAEPRDANAGDPCLSQPAREVHLARRCGCGSGDSRRSVAEPSRCAGLLGGATACGRAAVDSRPYSVRHASRGP